MTLGGRPKFWGNSYSYDAWGNLLQKTPAQGHCSGENLSVTVGANNQLHGGYTYDDAGNMIHDATANLDYRYDPENRMMGTGGFTYTGACPECSRRDADGNRVEKANGTTGTLYWYMTPGIVAESDLTGNLQSEYIFFDGERVARRDFPDNAVSYYFSDHLKTASVVTDSAGNIKSESDYYPWGGELQFSNNDSNHYKFTGKERDAETGLDYFGARYYSNGLGRFITPDWAAKAAAVPYADFADPQSLNLYTYVRNVPTSKVDVDGHCLEDACVVEAGVAVSFLVIATAQYLSMPSTQRSLSSAAAAASSTIRGWFHKNPPSTPTTGVKTQTPPSTATTGVNTQTPPSTETTGVNTQNPPTTSNAGTVSTSTGTTKTGSIYVVPGTGTKSGKPYVGRHNKPNPGQTRKSNDGRDRNQAEVVDNYPANDTQAGRVKEQEQIDQRGG